MADVFMQVPAMLTIIVQAMKSVSIINAKVPPVIVKNMRNVLKISVSSHRYVDLKDIVQMACFVMLEQKLVG